MAAVAAGRSAASGATGYPVVPAGGLKAVGDSVTRRRTSRRRAAGKLTPVWEQSRRRRTAGSPPRPPATTAPAHPAASTTGRRRRRRSDSALTRGGGRATTPSSARPGNHERRRQRPAPDLAGGHLTLRRRGQVAAHGPSRARGSAHAESGTSPCGVVPTSAGAIISGLGLCHVRADRRGRIAGVSGDVTGCRFAAIAADRRRRTGTSSCSQAAGGYAWRRSRTWVMPDARPGRTARPATASRARCTRWRGGSGRSGFSAVSWLRAATTNPLILLAHRGRPLRLVVAARRTEAPVGAWAFKYYVGLAGVVIAIRVAFRAVFGGGITPDDHVPVRPPQVPRPSAGSPGYNSAAQYPSRPSSRPPSMGCALAGSLCCIGAANALANPKRALRALPGALYELGLSRSCRGPRLSVAPPAGGEAGGACVARDGCARTHLRLRAVRSVAIPVLEDAL